MKQIVCGFARELLAEFKDFFRQRLDHAVALFQLKSPRLCRTLPPTASAV
jgi:hypothetical protein